MTHYSNSLAGHFGDMLARREAELKEALNTDKKKELADEQVGSGEVRDFKELAEQELEIGMTVQEVARITTELSQVLAARGRLRDGSFGQCVECGKPIELRRLQTMPAAPLCVRCQAADEQAKAGHHQSSHRS